MPSRVSYRILSWEGGQDGSRMIVASVRKHTDERIRMCVYQENFEFRSSPIASDEIWDKIVV